MDYYYNSSKAIRIPVNKIGAMSRFNEATSKLMQEKGAELTANDMYDKLEGFTNREIDSLIEVDNLNVLSYDKKVINGDGDSTSMIDLMSSDTESTDYMTINRDKEILTESLLSELTPNQREVIKKYFGIGNNGVTMTLSEISNEIGISRERVRMLKIKALKKLKSNPNILELNSF